MPVFKFRVYWEEDDNIYRDIALLKGQTFKEFELAILTAYQFDTKHEGSFYLSDDRWRRGMEISSEVFTNKKGAPALAMVKTPVSALVSKPDEKFVFVYDRLRLQTFLIEFIGLDSTEDVGKTYPYCFYSEGIAPLQNGHPSITNNQMMDVEEKYDLGKEEMDEGYSSDDNEDSEDSNTDTYSDDDDNMDTSDF